MYLLIAGFTSIGYLRGEAGLRELSFEFDCGISCSYSLTVFDVSAVGSVKQKLIEKECDKALQAL